MPKTMIPSKMLVDEVRKVAASLGGFSTMVVVGIGGSSLGLRAITSALQRSPHPHIIICDDLDPLAFQATIQEIDWEKT